MRMLLKAVMDTDAANDAARSGGVMDSTRGPGKPAGAGAAHFWTDGGPRRCRAGFDMTDTSQIAVIAEPLFLGAKARVTFAPCMNLDDLERGLSQVSAQGVTSAS